MDSNNQWMTQEINGGLIRAANNFVMGETVSTSSSSAVGSSRQQPAASAAERKANRPQKEQALCPRCHSSNTKFCYYNNYSLTQPRYFCKTCRRYWTQGGTLRNVPVGGGSRKNKKSSITSNTTSSSPQVPDPNPHQNFSAGNPNKIMMTREGQHLNLGFPAASPHHHPYHHNFELAKPSSASANSAPFAALELLRTTGLLANSSGIINPSNFNTTSGTSVAPAPDLNSFSGFSFQELKPFSSILEPRGGGGGIVQENGGRFMFPFGVVKQGGGASSTTAANEVDDQDQNNTLKGQQVISTNSNGFWNGMLGGTTTGGGSW